MSGWACGSARSPRRSCPGPAGVDGRVALSGCGSGGAASGRGENRVRGGRTPGRVDGMMSSFVPGLQLSRDFYTEVVRPLVAGVPHSAALIGAGSEVLAFDTERSTAHDWGPRVVLFTAA